MKTYIDFMFVLQGIFTRRVGYNEMIRMYYLPLPDRCKIQYSLRPRQHSKRLISKTTELNRDYILCECCTKMPTDVHLYTI